MSDAESMFMMLGEAPCCEITSKIIDEIRGYPVNFDPVVYAPCQYVICRRCWHIFDIYKTNSICDRCGETWEGKRKEKIKWFTTSSK